MLAARAQRGRAYYPAEMSDADHARWLRVAKAINCRVMISGYRSPLYDRELAGWRRVEFEVMTRGGKKATECLWMNYPRPLELHDYRFVGDTWRARQRLHRKIRRAVIDLSCMPAIERNALFAALAQVMPGGAAAHAGNGAPCSSKVAQGFTPGLACAAGTRPNQRGRTSPAGTPVPARAAAHASSGVTAA